MNLIIDATQAKIHCIDGFMNISIPAHCLAKRKDDIKHILSFLNETIPYPTLKTLIEEVMDCTLTPNPETLELDDVPPLPPSAPSRILTQEEIDKAIDKAVDKLQEDLEEKQRTRLENRELNEKDDDLFL